LFVKKALFPAAFSFSCVALLRGIRSGTVTGGYSSPEEVMSGPLENKEAGSFEPTPRTRDWSDIHTQILGEINDAVIVMDTQTRVLCWNKGAERLYGLRADEIVGHKLEESHQIRWETEGDEQAALDSLERSGSWRGENIHVTKGGRELHVESSATVLKDEHGAATGVLAVMRDITERKRKERLLRESYERFELAQHVAHIGWIDWRIPEDILLSSDEAQALHGMAPGTFRGGIAEWKANVHPEDIDGVDRILEEAMRDGGEYSCLYRVVWPGGSVRWLQTRFIVLLNSEVGAQRMVGVCMDVTELKEVEEELERRVAMRTSALQEKTEQMEAFVYSISHDLRAPLRSMEGFAEAVLEDEGGLRMASREHLRRISRAAQRMDALVCDLVNYTRLERAEMTMLPVSLERVLNGVLLTLDGLIHEKHATITVERPLPEVLGNGATLEVVVTNLISNSLKFVRPDMRPEISVWAETGGGKVKLWVVDNGIGIAPEHQERVFGVFERLHGEEKYAGTGIGLAIVRKAMQRMGGTCGVRSEQGRGSSFWIELPKGTRA
jgi:PAS domain S-box-containing protein